MIGVLFLFAGEMALAALALTVWPRRHRILAALRGHDKPE